MGTSVYNFNRDTTVTVYVTLTDENGNIIPLTTPDRFTVQIKEPYSTTPELPYSKGITGPTYIYNNNSGSSGAGQFYFTVVANKLGDWKYKVQYDGGASGSYQLIGPLIKTATVGSFRVVDDDF